MRTTVENWTAMRELDIVAGQPFDGIPSLVSLRTSGGSMTFQFDINAKQARQMAAALIEAAEFVERQQDPDALTFQGETA